VPVRGKDRTVDTIFKNDSVLNAYVNSGEGLWTNMPIETEDVNFSGLERRWVTIMVEVLG